MTRTPVLNSSAVPSRLGRLTDPERRIWQAFPQGQLVDLRTGDPELDRPANADRWSADREVRGAVIAALLLGACPAAVGAVAAVRIVGARITGDLSFDHGEVSPLLELEQCRFDGSVVFDGAVTESIGLRGSHLRTLSAFGAHVRGTFDLRDTTVTGNGDRGVHADGIHVDGSLFANRCAVTGAFCLINAQVGGQVTLIGAKLTNRTPGGKSLNAGGIRVGRSLLAQGLEAEGELRLPGAHIGSALVLSGATLDGLGAAALHGEALTVASGASFRTYAVPKPGERRTEAESEPATEPEPVTATAGEEGEQAREIRSFTAIGSVRLRGARFGGGLDLAGAQLTAGTDEPALSAERVVVDGSLHLGEAFHTDGEVELTGAGISGHLDLRGMNSPNALLNLYAATASGGVQDEISAWPGRLNLEGFTYGAFDGFVAAAHRIPLLRRQVRRADHDQVGGFRAQPYEQLAAYYRSLGSDGEARTVLLARQRAQRAELRWWQRLSGALLDLLVGYGYRPLRAIGWAMALLVASSVYFSQVRPEHVSTEDRSVFNPVLYAADHLIPVIHFGQTDVWQYHGVAAVVTVVLTVLGWTLGIAIAAAATRTLTRN